MCLLTELDSKFGIEDVGNNRGLIHQYLQLLRRFLVDCTFQINDAEISWITNNTFIIILMVIS